MRSLFADVLEIAAPLPEPSWLDPLGKVERGNFVLIEALDDPAVSDLREHLRAAIPARLRRLAAEGPPSAETEA